GCATFERSDTKLRKAFEYTMCQHARRLDHQTEGMAQGMSRVVGAEGIESHVMKTAHVYGQRAAEFFRLLVKRPVDLVSEMPLYRFAVGLQHSAEHPKLANRAAGLRNAA